jgi:hypothetical protein
MLQNDRLCEMIEILTAHFTKKIMQSVKIKESTVLRHDKSFPNFVENKFVFYQRFVLQAKLCHGYHGDGVSRKLHMR